MKCIFDSSAIFRAIKENRVDILVGNSTLELARYELGNVLWKTHTQQERATVKDLKDLMRVVRKALNVMEVLSIGGREEEILDTATALKVTFYDASYVFCAKSLELTLITEDARLLKKVPPQIKASRLDSVV
jgi:predicted nucleic acid-binding protein